MSLRPYARVWIGSVVLGAVLVLPGCDMVMSLIGGGGDDAAADAESTLVTGDLPGADEAFNEAAAKYPTAVDVATGAAFMALTRGDTDAADAALVAAEAEAGDRLPEIKSNNHHVTICCET